MSKTAMQELIEWIEQMPAFKCEPVVNGIHDRAKQLLKNEEKNIHDAYMRGVVDCSENTIDSESYYTQTFTQ